MSVAATSRQAYERVDLQAQEEALLREIGRYFQCGKFTRRELATRTGWETATISARVNSLLKKGLLTEYEQTRSGSHLLSISAAPVTSSAGAVAGTAPPVASSAGPAAPDAAEPEIIYLDGKPCEVVEGGPSHWATCSVRYVAVRRVG